PRSEPITLRNIRALAGHATLWGSAFCALSQLFTLHSLISFLPVLLHERAGLAETAIGPALAVMTFGMVVAAPIGGALGDRVGPRNVVRWAATLAAAGAGGLAALVLLLPSPFPLLPVLLCLAAIGLGFGAAQAGQVTLIIAWFPHLRGTALALYTMMRFTGGALGPLTLGSVADTAGLAPAFVAPFLVVSAAAAGAFLLIRDPVGPGPSPRPSSR
ncbi:MAG: MFS transporter, partial [Chloroflexi bacterium]|nr:MFS transporter [Chloroflexota bacterium]